MNKYENENILTNISAEKDGLKGPVKQVMQITHIAHHRNDEIVAGKIDGSNSFERKNFIISYNEQGNKTEEMLYGMGMSEKITYDDAGRQILKILYHKGQLYQSNKIMYDVHGNMVEYKTLDNTGKVTSRLVNTYSDTNQNLSDIHYYYNNNEETVMSKTLHEYEDVVRERNGIKYRNHLTMVKYDKEGNIEHQSYSKYDERGLMIEHKNWHTNVKSQTYDTWYKQKHNEQGDVIESIFYHPDGSIKNAFHNSYEYDSEGKKIMKQPPVTVYNDDDDTDDESVATTEQKEADPHGNWVKKTIFKKHLAVQIILRDILYYDEPQRTLIHPMSTSDFHIEEEKKATIPDIEPLKKEDAKWLTEDVNRTPDNFHFLRYYAMQFNEVPSVIFYTGPYIEALALLKELKKQLNAQVVHSYSTVYKGYTERIQRYTLTFHYNPGYLLHAMGITQIDRDEFVDLDFIEDTYDDYANISQLQLLLPGEASGRRDEYFEERLNDIIDDCSLRKKPSKPRINIIEVRSGNYVMVEHAVNDNFIIKDLDINYGYGFSKFHSDLMTRFNKSTKGLVLFHGEPGTGKTYYIRHLLRMMVANRKKVIYMPPNMVDHLTDPVFMTFLGNEVRRWSAEGNFCVLLIEDAEPLLAKRQEGVRIQGVTNLLNMTDGLLNDMLNLQIICTFNVDLRRLDSALLRPGRLIARKEFKALSELDANLLAQRLGIKHHFTKPATLGEIYAMMKDSSTLIHDVEPDRDASTIIDDLV
jgi:hypothetical protein